jgi:hypothetical protein
MAAPRADLVPTVVLGGEASLISDKIVPHLLEHGLSVIAHHDWYKARSMALPDATRVLFLMTDMVGHSLSTPMVADARNRGVKVVYGCRKYAVFAGRLAAAGFPVRPPEATVPLPVAPTVAATLTTLPDTCPELTEDVPVPKDLIEKIILLMAEDPTLSHRALARHFDVPYSRVEEAARGAREVLGIVPEKHHVAVVKTTFLAACASRGITSFATVPNSGTLPRKRGDATMPAQPTVPVTTNFRDIGDGTVLKKVLAHLSKNPLATNENLAAAFPTQTSSIPPAASAARKLLGLSVRRGRSAALNVDVVRWNAACRHYGLTDTYPVPPSGTLVRGLREHRPAVAPKAQTVSAAPVLAPEVFTADPLKDVRELVELLRSEMGKHRIESLTLTAHETKMQRLVAITESL